MGARIARVPEAWIEPVRAFAMNLGIAFQIFDDLLDQFAMESDTGKDAGQDEGKTTFVCVMGPDEARNEAWRYVKTAVRSLEPIGTAGEPLAELARSLIEPAMGTATHF
jgi:geranylgeranyl pyrophosphate synthase